MVNFLRFLNDLPKLVLISLDQFQTANDEYIYCTVQFTFNNRNYLLVSGDEYLAEFFELPHTTMGISISKLYPIICVISRKYSCTIK